MSEAWEAFERCLSAEEHLLADAEALAWPPPEAELRRLAAHALGTLSTLAALEERHSDLGEDDNPLMQELLRMDAKLSALVEIVNRWLLPADQAPQRHLVRFNARGAVVPAALLPAEGEGVLLRLRFDACRSLALEFAGQRMQACDGDRVFVAFAALGEASGDALERLVFRHHRRKVAVARQQGVQA